MNRVSKASAAGALLAGALLTALLLSSCSPSKAASTIVDFEMIPLGGSPSTTLSAVQGGRPALVTLWTST